MQKAQRDAEVSARRRTDELVQATSAALDELTTTAEDDRAAARREREQAENYRLEADRIQSALGLQLAEVEAERETVRGQREQIETALTAAEAFRAEARSVHENAQGVAAALLEAVAVRAELLESTLEERIAEVASTLATLQDLVLERPVRHQANQDATVRELLSTTFREIRDYRETELGAAETQADALIARAHDTAAEIVADTRREQQRLIAETDPRSVLDVVAVLLAESRPAFLAGSDESREADAAAEPITVSASHAPIAAPSLEPTADVTGTQTPDVGAPTPAAAAATAEAPEEAFGDEAGLNVDEDAAAVLSHALDHVEDPSRITDRELADVLTTTDRLLGDNATINGALDLARALADALGPEEPGDEVERTEKAATDTEVADEPDLSISLVDATADVGANGTSGHGGEPDEPTTETDVSIDLTAGDDPIVAFGPAEPTEFDRPAGRFRSLWRSLF